MGYLFFFERRMEKHPQGGKEKKRRRRKEKRGAKEKEKKGSKKEKEMGEGEENHSPSQLHTKSSFLHTHKKTNFPHDRKQTPPFSLEVVVGVAGFVVVVVVEVVFFDAFVVFVSKGQ